MVIRDPMDEPKAYCLRWSNHQANLVSVMDDLLVHKKLTDVALGTDDGPLIWCHKVILATCSPYFRKLFIDATSDKPIVLLKDTSYPVVKILLEYMYRGEVNVSLEHVPALLDLAALLQVKGLAMREELNFGFPPPPAPPSPMVGSTSGNGYEEAHPREASASSGGNSGERENERDHDNGRLNETVEEPAGHQGIHRNPLPPLIQRWPMSPMVLTEEQQSAVAAFANLHPFPATSYSLSQFYQNSPDTSCTRNPHYQTPQNPLTSNIQDTSILRSVLNLEQIDPTLRLPPNRQEPRNRRHRNRKNRPPQHLQRRSSSDLQQMPSTSREIDPTPVVESEQHRTTPQPSAEPVPSVSGYGGSQRQENKRYKKYDPRDIWMAIAEVQRGLSANKAAEKFKVPSRTLYDKIKKMKTSELHKQRLRSCETVTNVPNVQNDVQGDNASAVGMGNPVSSPNDETMSDTIDNPISMVETSLGEDRERSSVPERPFDSDRESPIPRGSSNANSQPASPGQLQIDDNDEEAEDLTVSRRPSNIDDEVSANSDNDETL